MLLFVLVFAVLCVLIESNFPSPCSCFFPCAFALSRSSAVVDSHIALTRSCASSSSNLLSLPSALDGVDDACVNPQALLVVSEWNLLIALCQGGLKLYNSTISTVIKTGVSASAAFFHITGLLDPLALDSARRLVYATRSVPMMPTVIVSISLADGSMSEFSLNIDHADCYNPILLDYDSQRDVLYAMCVIGIIAINPSLPTKAAYDTLLIANSSVCNEATGLSFDHARGIVYAACGSALISIDCRANNSVTSLQLSVVVVRYDSFCDCVYAAGSGGIFLVDIDFSAQVQLMPQTWCPSTAVSISIDSKSAALYAFCDPSSEVTRISMTANHMSISTSILIDRSQCFSSNSVFSESAIYFDSESGVLYILCDDISYMNGGLLADISQTMRCTTPILSCRSQRQDAIYALCGFTFVVFVDGETTILIAQVNWERFPPSLDCDNDNGNIYLGTSDTIYAVNHTNSSIRVNHMPCGNSVMVTLKSYRNILYFLCLSRSQLNLTGIDSDGVINFAVIVTDAPPQGPYELLVSDEGDVGALLFFVASAHGIIMIDGASAPVNIADSRICSSPHALSIDILHSVIYFACPTVGVLAAQWSRNSSSIGLSRLAVPVECGIGTTYFASDRGALYLQCSNTIIQRTEHSALTLAVLNGCDHYTINSLFFDHVSSVLYCLCYGLALNAISLNPFACPSGYSIAISSGSTMCAPCSPGRYSQTTISKCQDCLPGRYTVHSAAGYCQDCTKGKYQASESSTQCEFCQSGRFSNTSSLSSCFPCPPGTMSASNQSACTFCSIGSYQPSHVSIQCFPCGPGTFANVSGLSSCFACQSGSASANITSSTACIPCSVGRYTDGSSLTPICLPCVPGRFANSSGLSACASCAAGSFSSARFSSCSPCEAGKHQSSPSAIECVPCGPGTFANVTGLSSCFSCSAGSASANISSSTSCISCQPGSYTDGKVLTPFCITCQAGTYALSSESAQCTSCLHVSGISCANATVSVSAGYWGYISNNHVASLPCPFNLCIEGELFKQCQYGRYQASDNALCGRCNDGWSEWNGQCIDCTQGLHSGLVVVMILCSWFFVLIIHLTSQSINESSLLGVSLYFIQTALLMSGPSLSWLFWLSVLNFAPQNSATSPFLSMPCPLYLSQQHQMILSIVGPFIFFCLLLLTAILHRCFVTLIEYISPSLAPSVLPVASLHSYFRSLISLVLLSYSQISSTVLNYLHCVPIGSEKRVVFGHPAIMCNDDSTYQACVPVLWFLLAAVIVGVPVFATAFFTSNYEYFRDRSESRHVSIHMMDLSQTRTAQVPLRPSSLSVYAHVHSFAFPSRSHPDDLCSHDSYHLLDAATTHDETTSTGLELIENAPSQNTQQLEIDEENKNDSISEFNSSAAVAYINETDRNTKGASDRSIADDCEEVDMSSKSRVRSLSHWGIVFEPYDQRVAWWHIVLLVRRLITVLIDTFIITSPQWKMAAYTTLHFTSLLVHIHVKPYVIASDNRAELISLAVLVLLSTALTANPPPYDIATQVIITVLVLVPACSFAIAIARHLALRARKRCTPC